MAYIRKKGEMSAREGMTSQDVVFENNKSQDNILNILAFQNVGELFPYGIFVVS